jgi:hypothetical protein
MLKKIVIQNYRTCLKTSFNCHPNLSVLIGPNSSGKTNILQAVMLLHKLAEQQGNGPVDDSVTVSSRINAVFSSFGNKIRLSASLAVHTDEANTDNVMSSRQTWRIEGEKEQAATFKGPIWALARVQEESVATAHFPNYFKMYFGVEAPPDWTVRGLAKTFEFCQGMKYYGASQFTNPGASPPSFEIEIDKDGGRRRAFRLRGHVRVLYNMYSLFKANQGGKYDQFKSVVGPKGLKLIDDVDFKEVPISSTDYSVLVGGRVRSHRRSKLLVVPQFRIGRQVLSPNQLSEGTFKTLALLFYIITFSGTALLIEEPEVCIHHGLLSSILELIKRYSRQKQMIISTHSDYVLDHVRPENVFRVSREELLGTTVHPIRKTMNAREYAALREYLDKEGNLGEYWREGGLEDRP